MAPLDDRAALVTGGGRGIGRATALRLARDGAKVVVCSRTETQLRAVADEIAAEGGEALAVPCDVARPEQVERAVEETVGRFGSIDILVNNAGDRVGKPVAEMTVEDWDYTVNICLRSVFLFCREALRHMIPRERGRIINISSTSGRKGYPTLADYGAAKAGVIIFTEALATEVHPHGITTACICPGFVNTDLPLRFREPDKLDPSNWLRPEEIADMVAYLADDRSRFLSGSAIDVPRALDGSPGGSIL
jgi:NAD(P)-dependent dehydrogenase (short-subunit alcohol dehydrogenase family)